MKKTSAGEREPHGIFTRSTCAVRGVLFHIRWSLMVQSRNNSPIYLFNATKRKVFFFRLYFVVLSGVSPLPPTFPARATSHFYLENERTESHTKGRKESFSRADNYIAFGLFKQAEDPGSTINDHEKIYVRDRPGVCMSKWLTVPMDSVIIA